MSEVKNIPRLRFPEFYGSWEKKKLEDVGKIRMCKRIFNHQTSVSGDIPFYKIGTFGREPNSYISKELYHEFKHKYSYPKVGNILISAAGTIGRTVVFDGSPSYFQDSNIVWIDNKENLITNEFLYYIYKIVRYDSEGGTIKRLYNSIIYNAKFWKPSLPEQQKIADFLTAVDKRIELLEKKKTLLETYKKGVMKKIFNQEIRFKDDNGNDFPDWVKKKIEEITLRISTGLNPRKNFSLGNGDNYYVTIKNISNGKIDFSTCEKIDDEALVKIKNRSDLSRDDIIMSSIGNIGESYLLTSDPTNWNINESVFMLRPNQELINPVFFYYILTNNNANRYFLGNMTGSSFKSIKIGDLREMPVSLPSLMEQKKISKFLKSIDNQIELLETQIDKSKTWKKGLLQKMFV